MIVERIFKKKDILYVGLVEGRDYKGIGIPPSSLGGADSCLYEQVEVEVEYVYVKDEDNKVCEIVIARDKDGKVVYSSADKF